MNCCAARPFLQAFVDNELSPERAIEVEQHLLACGECSDEVALTRELARATRHSVGENTMCPQFRARLCRSMAQERRRQERDVALDPLSWKVIAPLAAAVAMAIFVSYGGSAYHRIKAASDSSQPTEAWDQLSTASSAMGPQENLMDFLVRNHSKGLPPGVVGAEGVDFLEPELGFAVHTPDLGRYGAHFEGAHLIPVGQRSRAAVLRYTLGGRRVTLYMYNPEELSLIRQHRNLQPRVIGGRAVFVGTSRGYSIATCERHGVGYAVTAELSGDESAELVAALDR